MTDGAAAGILDDADRERLRSLVRTDDDRESLAVEAPYTGETIGTVPRCAPADVERAVERSREAQESWAARSVDERAAVLQSVADTVLAHRAELLDLVQLETGKARFDALEEVLDIVVTADYYAQRGPGFLASKRRTGAIPLLTKTTEHAHPVGVAGLIEPWNYPLTLAVSDALPALLAGNGVVLKPAEATPFIALRAVELLESAGVPEGLVGVVTGEGERLGEPLISRVDHVTFTGSTAAGRDVAATAGEHLTDASLELGGKNAAVVLADADPDTVARGLVTGAYANAGQLCIATERVYVEREAFDAVLAAFVAATERVELGAAYDFGPDVGSLISERQLATVESHVDDARERGATVETGGERRPDAGPYFFEPTILTDLPGEAAAATEETFGPVVSVVPVDGVDETVARANDTDYGLHASVWTGDPDRGERVARRLDAGNVTVNDAYRATWASTDAPMGGVGDSGIGRRHGRQGVAKYTEPQTVATQRGIPLATPAGLPNRLVAAGATAGVRAVRALRNWSPFPDGSD